MGKIHHVDDRSIEHAKVREQTFAHRHDFLDGSPSVRSTRGFAIAAIGPNGPVHPAPALDVQPRHGGKAKGGVVAHSWGNTEQQIKKENTAHVVTEAVDASSSNPLDLMTSSQAGKRLPIPTVAWGQNNDSLRGSVDPNSAERIMGEAKCSPDDHTKLGKQTLPQSVKEN